MLNKQTIQSNDNIRKEKNIRVYIRSKKQDVFKGLAYSLTSYNEMGQFDVLSFHANFVTLAQKEIIIDKDLSTEYRLPIDNAIVYVSTNKVDVYLGLA